MGLITNQGTKQAGDPWNDWYLTINVPKPVQKPSPGDEECFYNLVQRRKYTNQMNENKSSIFSFKKHDRKVALYHRTVSPKSLVCKLLEKYNQQTDKRSISCKEPSETTWIRREEIIHNKYHGLLQKIEQYVVK